MPTDAPGTETPVLGSDTQLPDADPPAPDNIIALAEATAAEPDSKKETVAEKLVHLAEEAELFHDDNQETFVSAIVKGHRETWSLKSRASREYLARRYYEDTDKVAGGQALQDALNVLHGHALHDGPEMKTYVRIAHLGDRTFLDLADDQRHVIEIHAGAWSFVTDPAVRFRRPRGMQALPMPEPGGTLDELNQFVNIVKPSAWRLTMAWLIALFFRGPYTWLVFQGRQGTAKTASSRFLRQTVDPNKSPVRAPPKKVRDLVIGAANSVIMVFDNVSYLDEEHSDALCRLSTGGGLSSRELYTDLDEVIIEVQRAGILNGITDIIARGDLLDRCILLELPPIPKGQRKTEAQMADAFQQAWPRLLGALLDTVAAVHHHLPHVHVEDPPRMADFGYIGVALERALNWPAGTFLSSYEEAINAATEVALDVSVIAPIVKQLADAGGFEGTATDLFDRVNDMYDGRWPRGPYGQMPGARSKPRPEGWPKSPRALSAQMRRLEPSLLAKSVSVTFVQTHGEGSRKLIIIRRVEPEGAPAQAAPPPPAPAPIGAAAPSPAVVPQILSPTATTEPQSPPSIALPAPGTDGEGE